MEKMMHCFKITINYKLIYFFNSTALKLISWLFLPHIGIHRMILSIDLWFTASPITYYVPKIYFSAFIRVIKIPQNVPHASDMYITIHANKALIFIYKYRYL